MTREEAMIHTLVKENDELQMEIGRLRQALEQQSCENKLATERYQDLVDFFDNKDIAKEILEDREEFKKWLDRMKWHVRKVDELARKLEEQESVLNKIRTEIETEYGQYDICEYFEDYDYEENDISEYRPIGDVADILQIIDKYRADMRGAE